MTEEAEKRKTDGSRPGAPGPPDTGRGARAYEQKRRKRAINRVKNDIKRTSRTVWK